MIEVISSFRKEPQEPDPQEPDPQDEILVFGDSLNNVLWQTVKKRSQRIVGVSIRGFRFTESPFKYRATYIQFEADGLTSCLSTFDKGDHAESSQNYLYQGWNFLQDSDDIPIELRAHYSFFLYENGHYKNVFSSCVGSGTLMVNSWEFDSVEEMCKRFNNPVVEEVLKKVGLGAVPFNPALIHKEV